MDLAKKKSLVGPIRSDWCIEKGKAAPGGGSREQEMTKAETIKFFKNVAKGSRKMKVVRSGILFL